MMQKVFIFLVFTMILFGANIFSVSGSNGDVAYKRIIKHKDNLALSQNTKEYSYQAFYNELQQQKILAIKAEAANKQKEQSPQKTPKTYQANNSYCIGDTNQNSLIEDAKNHKGGKYVWGGTNPRGFDCSGYVQYLYGKHGVKLPRTALAQSKVGLPIDPNHLKQGDLVFFMTDKKRNIPITHVGIYVGNGQFIHAASKDRGIIISPLNSGSYSNTFVGAKRVLPS
ncbi:MAG: C40 family peptidase [Campylobacterales bacterium]|nr:C40 family peptidase [Campylobacterales bacterium]